jgi:N-acetylmuramoyl-L-alanine amidase
MLLRSVRAGGGLFPRPATMTTLSRTDLSTDAGLDPARRPPRPGRGRGLPRPARAAAIILALSTMVPAAASAGPLVRRVRHWTAPDHTRVVIDLDGEARYRVRVLEDPHRVAVDIASGRFGFPRDPIPVEDGLVRRVRLNQLRSGAQVVLDLHRAPEFEHFSLRPYRDKPHRIVLDIRRSTLPPEVVARREALRERKNRGDYIVVVDPGHGGDDPGAVARGLREKDLALTLSGYVASSLDSLEGVSAVLTRSRDYFIPLAGRTRFARERAGDLFLSIHMNSAPRSRARGMEIFFLSTKGATDKAARVVADRENAADYVGGIPQEAPDDIFSILVDMKQNRTIQRSSELAEELLTGVQRGGKLPVRKVKQAGLAVLKDIEMPSVLLEMGFITNRQDVGFLTNRKRAKWLAAAIARGVRRYFERFPETREVLASTPLIHRVRCGETLWSISRTYGVTVAQLRRLNGLGSNDLLPVGYDLTIRQ